MFFGWLVSFCCWPIHPAAAASSRPPVFSPPIAPHEPDSRRLDHLDALPCALLVPFSRDLVSSGAARASFRSGHDEIVSGVLSLEFIFL